MVTIRAEGASVIVGLMLCATVLALLSLRYPPVVLKYAALVNWVLVLLVINFFRDPDRNVPLDPRVVISPADGKIIDIATVHEGAYLRTEATRISIFMSVFDVHVNRAPLDGQIDFLDYRQGGFAAAYREDASSGNEQLCIGLVKPIGDAEGGQGELKIMIKLVAGYLARRILFWKSLHDQVRQGERISMIKFGSRVEVFLPAEWEIAVANGQRVRAGETVVGRLKTR